MTSHRSTRTRWGAIAVVIGPAVMAAALVVHPLIPILLDEDAVARAVAADTTRWAIVHVTVAVASGLLLLSFLALRRYLAEAGDDGPSAWGLPFVAVGSVLFAVLAGLEFAPFVAARAGGDPAAAQGLLRPWFIPILVGGAAAFGVGIIGFARGISRSRILDRASTRLVVVALGVLAISRFVPVGVVQFHLQAAAGIVALWPIAAAMWRQPASHHSTVVATQREETA